MNIQILPGAIYFFKVFFFHFNTKGHIQHVPGANNKKKVQITKNMTLSVLHIMLEYSFASSFCMGGNWMTVLVHVNRQSISHNISNDFKFILETSINMTCSI